LNEARRSLDVSSRSVIGADTCASDWGRTLYALAMLFPRAFCIAST
jgi:hypothetical protein